jgi:polyisoprenoid-binding protein YceI
MRWLMLAAFAAVAVSPVSAQNWRMDPRESRLAFTSTQQGTAFEGGFRRFDGDIKFDPADPSAARITIRIDVASVFTGSAAGDQQAPGADWFDTTRHPQARFETREVKRLSGDEYQVEATLTIRDQSRPVSLPVTIRTDGDRAHAQGKLTINRGNFGVGRGQFQTGGLVGLSVEIRFDVTATKVP